MNSDDLNYHADEKKQTDHSSPYSNSVDNSNIEFLLGDQNSRLRSKVVERPPGHSPTHSVILPPAPASITSMAAGTGINRLTVASALPPPPPSLNLFSVGTAPTPGQVKEIRYASTESKYPPKSNISSPTYTSESLSSLQPNSRHKPESTEAKSFVRPTSSISPLGKSPYASTLTESTVTTSTATAGTINDIGRGATPVTVIASNNAWSSSLNSTETGVGMTISVGQTSPTAPSSTHSSTNGYAQQGMRIGSVDTPQFQIHNSSQPISIPVFPVQSQDTQPTSQPTFYAAAIPLGSSIQFVSSTASLSHQMEIPTLQSAHLSPGVSVLEKTNFSNTSTTHALFPASPTNPSPVVITGRMQTLSVSPFAQQAEALTSPVKTESYIQPTAPSVAQTQVNTSTSPPLGQTETHSSSSPSLPQTQTQTQTYTSTPASVGQTQTHTPYPPSVGMSPVCASTQPSLGQNLANSSTEPTLRHTHSYASTPPSLVQSETETSVGQSHLYSTTTPSHAQIQTQFSTTQSQGQNQTSGLQTQTAPTLPTAIYQSSTSSLSPHSLQATSAPLLPPALLPISAIEPTESTVPANYHLDNQSSNVDKQQHSSIRNINTFVTPPTNFSTPPEPRAMPLFSNNLAFPQQTQPPPAQAYKARPSPVSIVSTSSVYTPSVTSQSEQHVPLTQKPAPLLTQESSQFHTNLPQQTSTIVTSSQSNNVALSSSASIIQQSQTRTQSLTQLQLQQQQISNAIHSDNASAPLTTTTPPTTSFSTAQPGQLRPPLTNNFSEFSAGLAQVQATLIQPNTSQLTMGQQLDKVPSVLASSYGYPQNQADHSVPSMSTPYSAPPPLSTYNPAASSQSINSTASAAPHTVSSWNTLRPPLMTPPPASFHASKSNTTTVPPNDPRDISTPAKVPLTSSAITTLRTSGPLISSSPLMGDTNRPPPSSYTRNPPMRPSTAPRATTLDVTDKGSQSADSPVNPAFNAQLSPIILGYGGSPALVNSEAKYSLTSPTQPLNRLGDPGFVSPQGPGFVSPGGIRNMPPLQLISIGSPISPSTPQHRPPNQQLFTHTVSTNLANSTTVNNGNGVILGPPKSEPNTYAPLPPPSMFIDQPIRGSASDRLGGSVDSTNGAADDSAGKSGSESARPLTGRSAVGSYASPRKSSKSLGPTHPKKANSRIDPAQMPRPQALELEVKFYTRSGSGRKVPPLSNAGFQAIDNGNCSPRYLRLTTAAPAVSLSMQNTIGLPLGMVFTPFARPENGEKPIPLIDYQQLPPRCTRCKGYINCSVKWINDGNSWICNLCYMTNTTPAWYFSSLDGNGLRLDRDEHAELNLGSYEFLAGPDYCTRPLQEPIYIFAIDISVGAQATEATSASIKAVTHALSSLPTHEKTKVGIFTFDTKIQFYHYRESANDQVQLLVVDSEDPTPALPLSQWLLPASTAEHRATIESILQRIAGLIPTPSTDAANMHPPPAGYSSGFNVPYTPERRSCPTAAIKVAQLALQKSGGQVYLLTSSNPTCGYGKITKSREAMSAYGTERELSLYGAIDAIEEATENLEEKAQYAPYLDLATICLEQQISLNIILINSNMDEFRDVSLYSHLSDETGGNFFYVTGPLQLEENVQRLISQLQSVVENIVASESVMKIRTNVGLKVVDFIGTGKYYTMDDELYSASMDTNSTFCCGLQQTSTFKDEDRVFIQLAVLYTDLQMRRVIRIHNMRTFATAAPGLVYKTSDLDCVLTLVTKRLMHKTLRKSLLGASDDNPRNQLVTQLIDMLCKYRLSCSAQSPKTQLILPEALKLMPLYSLCLLKHPSLLLNKTSQEAKAIVTSSSASRQLGQPLIIVRAHERAYEIRKLRAATVRDTVNFLYPRLYVLHAVADDDTIELTPADRATEIDVHSIPRLVAVSSEYFDTDGLYLLNDMSVLWVYIGRSLPTSDILNWFGVDVGNLNAKPKQLTFTSNVEAKRMKGVVDILRKIGLCKQEVKFVWGDDVGTPNFERLAIRLVEDSMRGEQSYVDYLCKLHSQIQAKL